MLFSFKVESLEELNWDYKDHLIQQTEKLGKPENHVLLIQFQAQRMKRR